MSNRNEARTGGSWTPVFVSGIVAGVIINIIEWAAHRVWLDAQWNAAFAALGRIPSFWSTFVVANFLVGLVGIWSYRWLAGFYGTGRPTAVKTALGMWIIFWIVPIAGLQPFDLFPNHLLALVIGVGLLDVAVGILPAIALYGRLMRSPPS